jgi:hypothetical protein
MRCHTGANFIGDALGDGLAVDDVGGHRESVVGWRSPSGDKPAF